MNKKRSYKSMIYCLFLSLLWMPMWASLDFPNPVTDNIDPPPIAPIDNYIVEALIISIVMAWCICYKSKKTYSK